MIEAPLALAFASGMLATVNPCGFAMLPAYLAFFLGIDGRDRDVRASVAPVARSGAVGVGRVPAGVQRGGGGHLPPVGVGRPVDPVGHHRHRRGARGPRGRHGAGLSSRWSTCPSSSGAAAPATGSRCSSSASPTPSHRSPAPCRCSRARWRARSGGRTWSPAWPCSSAYSLGMTLVLLALTVSMGLARQGLVQRLRRTLPYVTARLGGAARRRPAPTSPTTAGTSDGSGRATWGTDHRSSTPSPAGRPPCPVGSQRWGPPALASSSPWPWPWC